VGENVSVHFTSTVISRRRPPWAAVADARQDQLTPDGLLASARCSG
jgi:hypothetical protein